MRFFGNNYNKPGPGVSKDEPRKKGVKRFFELFTRDFADYTKLNLIFCIVLTPAVVAFVGGSVLLGTAVGFAAGLILAFPVGGALTAYYYYISKMMRDEPSYVWFEFKRKFIENYRQAAPIGMLCTGFIFAQVLLWSNVMNLLWMGEVVEEIIWYFFALLSLFVFMMILPYIFLHFAYVNLGTVQTMKNSIIITFGYLPRSMMGSIQGGAIWIFIAISFPASLIAFPLVVLFGISLSMLLSLMWVWPVFDKCFKVEETLIKRAEDGEV